MTGLSGKKGFENPREHLGRNTFPVIRYFDMNVIARREREGSFTERLGQTAIAGADGDLAILAGRLNGVVQDLHERLLHFRFVESGGVELAFQPQRPMDFASQVFDTVQQCAAEFGSSCPAQCHAHLSPGD